MTMTDSTTELDLELDLELDAVSAPRRGVPVRAMAFGLWGVVGSLLAYGVLQTTLKAAALFG
jgi:hypothetical protein